MKSRKDGRAGELTSHGVIMGTMTELEQRVCSAWRQASADLGVQFSAPFVVTTARDLSHSYLGLVHHFGRPRGTLICMTSSECPPLPIDSTTEYYLSLLSESYAVYERELFIETLNDWGWCGPAHQRPAWFAGAP
jgi:hypothetical protein